MDARIRGSHFGLVRLMEAKPELVLLAYEGPPLDTNLASCPLG